MKFTKNKMRILFILSFVLFFNSLIVQAMPKGTILYKTSENGKMYGYNDYYEFSLIPGKAHFGGVGIYIGNDRLTKEQMIVEVDYSGVRIIPAKYFVDLDKEEKFIDAKIPTRFNKMTDQIRTNTINQILKNIYTQEGEGFDFTYHKQKGPQSGDWTPAGFIEKIYESAESHQLAYHNVSIGDVLTYSINITQDGYDNESEINAHHDVFSERLEYSKIHTLSQGDFWEQFFNKEVQDTLNLITNRAEQEQDRLEKDDMKKWEDELKGKNVKDKDIAEDYNYATNLEKFSKIAKGIKDIINVTIYGREYEKNRYFFFPYTQFQQKTLMHVDVDPSEVSSHGKAEAVGGLSLTQQRVMMTTAFFERLVYALVIEKGKDVVMNFLGIGKIISSINAVKTSIGVGEEGMQLLSGGNVDIDTEKMVKEALSKNEYAQAALSFKKDADDFYQAGINESLEFFDLVNKGHLKKGGEFQKILDLELAKISGEDEEIIDTRPVIRQLGDVIDISPIDIEKEIEKELKKLQGKKVKDADLQKLKELIDDSPQDLENKSDEVEPVQEQELEKLEEIEKIEEPEESRKVATFQQGDVVINEFIPDPISRESEWIELYNKTDQSINLSVWTIEDNTGPSFGGGSGKKSLKDVSIIPKGFIVLIKGEHFNFNLNNSGDIIILKYNNNIIDQVSYGDFYDGNTSDNAPGLEKGQALARIQDGQDTNQDNNDWFVTITPTQSLINQITVPIIETIQTTQPQVSYGGGGGGSSSPSYQAYQTGDAVINEIMYNVSGSDPGHEWLEIYNTTKENIDLTNWKFYEQETNHNLTLKQGDWILIGGAYAVIADDADQFLLDYSNFSGTLFDSSFSLNNTSEIIIIKDGQDNVINEVIYLKEWGGAGDGKSIEKKSDGTWEQSLSINGTPGQENSAHVVEAQSQQEEEDTTSPVITLLGDATVNLNIDDFYTDEGATALDDVDGDITASIVVGDYTVDISIIGTYVITYNVTDNAGNTAIEITRTVYVVDPTAPILTEVTPISTPTNDNTPDYIFNSNEAGTITYNGGCLSATTDAIAGDNTITINELVDGTYGDCAITVTDSSSNQSAPLNILTFTIDTTIPDIAGLSDDTTPTKSKIWNWSSSDSIAQFRYIINQSSIWTPVGEYGNTKTATQNIGDGIYYLHVQAKDSADNESEAVIVSAVLDNTPPTIILLEKPSNPTSETAADITVSGDDVTHYKYKLDDGAYSDEREVSEHIVLSGLSDREYTVYVVGRDAAGNWQEQAKATTYTWTINTTEPISSIDDLGSSIFNVASLPETIGGDISSNTDQVEIQIKRGENSDYLDDNDVYEWHADRDELWITKGVILDKENNTWSYNLPIELLQEQDNKYFIRSRAKDSSKNIQNNYSEINFIFDKTPPGQVVNLGVQEQATQLDLKLSWNEISDNFSGTDHYEIDWGDKTVRIADKIYNLTGTNRTIYSFKVRAVDKAGNTGEWSNIKLHPIKIKSLVISEIQISGDKEFVELYNPNNENISLNNWYFAYYSSGQDWDGTPHRLKQFPNGAVIKSKGYYLIGVYGYSESNADWQVKTDENQPYSNGQLSNTDGSVVIYSSSPKKKFSDKLKKEYIDTVAWGDVQHVKESDAYPSAPEQDKSLQRKENQDTDDNANDFFIQESPNPQSVYGLWLNGWSKRKLLVIDNKQNANALIDYQIKIDIIYQSGMQSDFSDIRFTSSNGQTLLSYYREGYIDSESAVFWIKVPSILAYSEVVIYQYYNNDEAVYEGNGKDVFIWFDDFSTNRAEEYNHSGVIWDTERKRIKLVDNAYISPLDKNSGEKLEIKNFYIKTKMYLEKETDRYLTNMANQAFIDYRHSDNNTISTDSFNDDDYWKFGINNTLRNNAYRGLRFDKNINTENIGQATNILKIDNSLAMKNYFDKWGVYEIRAYETNHQLNFEDESSAKTTWSVNNSYLNTTGKIYLRALDFISTTSWVWIDYLMIGQSTLPEPTIVIDKSEGYTATKGQTRNSYPDFSDWSDRKTIKITNTSNTTSTIDVIDYPIKIETSYLAGINKDFSDIRFVDPDKPGIDLKYWNESYIDSTSAIFWVKIPKIPGTVSGNGEKTIYMYYNNPSATYIGKGEDVFILFDNFETYRQSEYEQSSVGWDTERGRIKFSNNGYIVALDDSGNKLEMKDVYIKTKMFLEKETGIYPGYPTYRTNRAYQGFIDYRYQDDNNYWRFGLNHKNTYIYKGVIFGSKVKGNPFFRPLLQPDFYDKWGTFEIKAADNNHELRFVNENGQDWTAIGTGLNQKGSIYLRGLDIASTSWMWVDYLIISKYRPEIKVSD